MEDAENHEELLAKQHRKEKKDLQGKKTDFYLVRIVLASKTGMYIVRFKRTF